MYIYALCTCAHSPLLFARLVFPKMDTTLDCMFPGLCPVVAQKAGHSARGQGYPPPREAHLWGGAKPTQGAKSIEGLVQVQTPFQARSPFTSYSLLRVSMSLGEAQSNRELRLEPNNSSMTDPLPHHQISLCGPYPACSHAASYTSSCGWLMPIQACPCAHLSLSPLPGNELESGGQEGRQRTLEIPCSSVPSEGKVSTPGLANFSHTSLLFALLSLSEADWYLPPTLVQATPVSKQH